MEIVRCEKIIMTSHLTIYAVAAVLGVLMSSGCVKSIDRCEGFPDKFDRASFQINPIKSLHSDAGKIASAEIESCYPFHQYLEIPSLILKGISSSPDGREFLVYEVPGATDVEILFQFDAAGRVNKAYQQSTL